VAERYFSVADVEALIPELTEIMADVMTMHRAVNGARERMQSEQQRIAQAGGGVINRAAWRDKKERIEQLTAAIQRGLGKIVELGGAPKDLSLGLVDFLHMRDGREVNLCWKYGEREIRHWHGLDEGYARRKPL
jgi:hypothetical protein